MKKFYSFFAMLAVCLMPALGTFAQLGTTRSLTWAAGNQNWPTSTTSIDWKDKNNWINNATGLAPVTNVTNGDKLIIPTTGSPVISVTASMTITFTNFIIQVEGNGLIDIGRGFDLNLSAATNTAVNLVAVNANKGLSLQRAQGATNTTLTMNGRIKALNTSNSTAFTLPTLTSANALGSDVLVATVTGIGGFLAGALPVVLSNFTANLTTGKKVAISWTTQQELNSGFFDVQKSADGVNWKSIGTVKAAGYSSNPISYNAVDLNPSKGSNFYRLRMNDLDGKFAFSPVKIVRLDGSGRISLYPNPSTDVLNISLGEVPSADWSVSLFNNAGQMMIQKRYNKNTTTVALPVNSYPAGNYVLKITDGKNVQTNKLIISHH
jgi:Secretion system C-terminal sorting domain